MLDWLPGLVTVTALAPLGGSVVGAFAVEVFGALVAEGLEGSVVEVPEFPLVAVVPHALATAANNAMPKRVDIQWALRERDE